MSCEIDPNTYILDKEVAREMADEEAAYRYIANIALRHGKAAGDKVGLLFLQSKINGSDETATLLPKPESEAVPQERERNELEKVLLHRSNIDSFFMLQFDNNIKASTRAGRLWNILAHTSRVSFERDGKDLPSQQNYTERKYAGSVSLHELVLLVADYDYQKSLENPKSDRDILGRGWGPVTVNDLKGFVIYELEKHKAAKQTST